MKQNPKTLVAWFKDFVVFCGLGCASGVGVGFFIFLRLGLPKESQYMIGYICGLFIISGLKFGIGVWIVRILSFSLLHFWAEACGDASRYQSRDKDLKSGDKQPAQLTSDVSETLRRPAS
jgi:hypothetical protein